jgi:hypothetical protein
MNICPLNTCLYSKKWPTGSVQCLYPSSLLTVVSSLSSSGLPRFCNSRVNLHLFLPPIIPCFWNPGLALGSLLSGCLCFLVSWWFSEWAFGRLACQRRHQLLSGTCLRLGIVRFTVTPNLQSLWTLSWPGITVQLHQWTLLMSLPSRKPVKKLMAPFWLPCLLGVSSH